MRAKAKYQNPKKKMPSSRILTNKFPTTFSFFTSSSSTLNYRHLTPSQHRLISSTSQLHNSWVDKVKGVFTGQQKKTTTGPEGGPQISSEAFTLLRESPTSPPCHSKAVLFCASHFCWFLIIPFCSLGAKWAFWALFLSNFASLPFFSIH